MLSGIPQGRQPLFVQKFHSTPGQPDHPLALEVAEHPGDHLSMGFQVVGDGLMGDAQPGDFRRLEMKEAASFYYMERSMTSSFFRAVR